MIKTFFHLFLLVTISCKSQNNEHPKATAPQDDFLKETMDSKYWPIDFTNHANAKKNSSVAFEHYFTIGDCFALTYKDSCFGLMLFDIVKTSDEIEYEFILQDHIYKTIPTIVDFKRQNFWGRKTPDETIRKNIIGFNTLSFSDSFLSKNKEKFIMIGHENLSSNEDRTSGSGGGDQISDIARNFLFHTRSKNGEFENEGDSLSTRDTSFSFSLLWLAKINDEIKQPQYIWTLTKKDAHPNAKKLMPEDWWYSEADDFAPFGSDDGSDALYGFKNWRDAHPKMEPSLYFSELEAEWGTSFQQKDWTDYDRVKSAKNSSILYTSIDYGIIGVAFAQLVLEGKISPILKALAKKAILRQLLLTEKNDYPYTKALKAERIGTLKKQQAVIEATPL